MPAVHRHGDLRVCGATTTVIGQSTVFSDGVLWAVEGDTNTDGNGQLIASGTNVFVEGKKVIVHAPDHSEEDDKCPLTNHCDPYTAEGSTSTVSAY